MDESVSSPLPKRADLLLDIGSLPTPPAVVLKIVRLMADEGTSMGEIADAVALDAALAARVLKSANSAAFSPRSRVLRLDQAMSMLGLGRFRSVIMRSAMSDLLPASEGEVSTQIRRRTVINATLSRTFAEELKPKLAEEAFLGGLLGSLGHLVLARHSPLVHEKLCGLGSGWPLPQHEEGLLGYLVDDVTGDLLASWSMPDVLWEAIMLRSDTRLDWGARVADPNLIIALRLGLLAERVLCGSDPASALGDLLTFGRQVLGLELLRLSEILVETEPLVAELAQSMNFEAPNKGEHEAILEEAIAVLQASDVDAQLEAGGLIIG